MWESKLNLMLEPGQRVWFTSDTHFGHKNVIEFGHRPFENRGQMERGLTQNWNKVVSDRDIVFILGDFYYHSSRSELQRLVGSLKGKTIYFIPGNHDKPKAWESVPSKVEILDCISTVFIRGCFQTVPTVSLELVLSHYPLLTWPHWKSYGCIHLFGHIHSGPYRENFPLPDDAVDVVGKDLFFPKGHKMIDVGVDANNYTPLSLYEICKRVGIHLNWSTLPGIEKKSGYDPNWRGLLPDPDESETDYPLESFQKYSLEDIPLTQKLDRLPDRQDLYPRQEPWKRE